MIVKTSKNEAGYTLYMVLIILTVGAILFSSALLYTGLTQKETIHEVQRVQARLLAESGITRAEYFLNGGDGHNMHWETENFQEKVKDYGDIYLKVNRFGLFSRIESKGNRVKTACTISGLCGRDIPDILKPSLTLTGHVGGLILHENSIIESYIVLHHGDIYNERRGRPLTEYQKKLIIRESQSLPFDSLLIPDIIDKLKRTHESLRAYKSALNGDHVWKSTDGLLQKKDTIVVLGDCQIENCRVYDKVLSVFGRLVISRGAFVEGSQMYAEKIIVNDGIIDNSLLFSSKKIQIKGGYLNSQLFSKDSMCCTNDAKFGQMAILTCLRSAVNDTIVSGGIYLEAGTAFRGTLIGCMDLSNKKINAGPTIVLGYGSSISGCVITNHDLDFHQAEIKGHVWARTIMTQYEGKSFTNYLIKSSIVKPDQEILFPLAGSLPAKIRGKKSLKEYYNF